MIWMAIATFFRKAWGFLGTPVGTWTLRAAICIAILACGEFHGFSRGVAQEKAAEAKREAANLNAAKKLASDSAKISAKARTDLDAANKRNADLTLELQQKAKTYVTNQDDRACRIPSGYVLMRNAAGAGVRPVPSTADQPLDADSGVVLSEVLENDIANASAFHAATNEIKAWRGWYAAQADLWNAKTTSVDSARP